MTPNSKKLAAFSVVWSIAFFSLLHWALFNPDLRWPFILAGSITYGVGFGLAGFLLGRKDSARNTRHNIGLIYSLTTNIISFVVGGIWIAFFRQEEWRTLVIMAVIFAFFSTVAVLASKNTIKGIEKDKLFR